jgi:arginase
MQPIGCLYNRQPIGCVSTVGETGGVTVIAVPFHLDEHLPDLELPLAADRTITPDLPPGSPWERMALLYEEVAEAVAAEARAGRVPVMVSGDCTTSLGVVAGLQRAGRDPRVVWFDGHGDVQTPETTSSGYVGGFPVRQLVGGSDRTAPDRLGLRPVPEQDVVLVDARDLDPPEAEYLARAAIRATGGPALAAVTAAVRTVVAAGGVAAVGLACTYRPGSGADRQLRGLAEAVSGLE